MMFLSLSAMAKSALLGYVVCRSSQKSISSRFGGKFQGVIDLTDGEDYVAWLTYCDLSGTRSGSR